MISRKCSWTAACQPAPPADIVPRKLLDFLCSELESAIVRPAAPDVIQVTGVEEEALQVLDTRRIGEAHHERNVRTLLEVFDVSHPRHETITIDMGARRSEHGQVAPSRGKYVDH